MRFFDILCLILSFLGLDGLVLSLRYLVPCYFIPVLSAQLNATQQLLSHAEMVNAIAPPDLESEYKAPLYLLASQFAAMRTESNLALGSFQQLRLIIWRGLTCRLYVLYYRIEGMKSKLELAIDGQQLRATDSVTGTAVLQRPEASPAAATSIPANDVVDPTVPLPAT